MTIMRRHDRMTFPAEPLSPFKEHGTSSALPVALVALGCLASSVWLMLSGADQQLSRALIIWMSEHPDVAANLSDFSTLYEVKGVLAATAIWWVWSRPAARTQLGQRIDAAALVAVIMVAILIGRMTANLLPYRPRPFVDPAVAGELAQTDAWLQDWSSFPSDHAMIFGAFAVAMLRVAPRLGWWLLGLHAVLLVSLPRILVGKHYASDVLAGLAVGAAIGWLLFPIFQRGIAAAWTRVPATWRREYLGYPFLFLVSFEIATNFDGARRILRALHGALT